MPVAVCGEMAGDVPPHARAAGLRAAPVLHASGAPASVKQQVLKSDLGEVMVLTQKMLKSDDPEKLEQLLARMNR